MRKKSEIPKRKMSEDELQQWYIFRRRGSRVENRKGKGSYRRNPKHRKNCDE
jgi:stalled ribosome alternative rescue factor ArfA